MIEKKQHQNKSGFSLDWLVGGVLTKLGETLDRITGRGWNPSSSLATSKLIEKLKFLLDEESKEVGSGRFAPHVITLKIQWNKFASDSDDDLQKLTDELHAAAIDHINDKLYHTFGPIKIDIKNDYFTEGVRLIGSFGEFGEGDDEAAVNVTLPNIKYEDSAEGSRVSINLDETRKEANDTEVYKFVYVLNGRERESKVDFSRSGRVSIGRAAQNELMLDHQSVSKVHASLVLNKEGRLLVADTGSTNGTYVSAKRIPYGKAVEVTRGDTIRFGSISVEIKEIADSATITSPDPGASPDDFTSPLTTGLAEPPVIQLPADTITESAAKNAEAADWDVKSEDPLDSRAPDVENDESKESWEI